MKKLKLMEVTQLNEKSTTYVQYSSLFIAVSCLFSTNFNLITFQLRNS
jgi:hypothetical protein